MPSVTAPALPSSFRDNTISSRAERLDRRNRHRANMAHDAAIATALQALAAAINNMNQPAAPAPHQPMLDPFQADQPFDLSSRAGAAAFGMVSAALDEPWDGSVTTFPSFITSLRLRASEGHWDAAAPHGFVRKWQQPVMTPAKHQAYAVQWFSMSAVLCLVWLIFIRKHYASKN